MEEKNIYCDRCKEKINTDGFSFRWMIADEPRHATIFDKKEKFDLCQKCRRDFSMFLKNKE